MAHRGYPIRGSKLRMFLHSDRIEISTLGGLLDSFKLESKAYRLFTRNQVLFHFPLRMKSTMIGDELAEVAK